MLLRNLLCNYGVWTVVMSTKREEVKLQGIVGNFQHNCLVKALNSLLVLPCRITLMGATFNLVLLAHIM